MAINTVIPNHHQLKQENDFILKKVELQVPRTTATYDISNLRVKIDIFQDIYSGAMGGSIDIFDSMDLPHMMPLLGDEKLHIVFTRYDVNTSSENADTLPNFDMTFRIYKMSERMQQNTKSQSYTLHFVSEEYIKNFKTKISRGFKATKYSDMVDKIYNEKIQSNKPLVVEPTKYEFDFIVRNISAFEFFNMIASRAISDAGNGPGYFFYEDTEQFNFVSIGKLLTQQTAATYIYQVANILKDEGTDMYKPRDIEGDIIRAQHYMHTASFDVLKNLVMGLYGSNAITIDPIRKVYDKLIFDLDAQFDEFKHLHSVKPFADTLDTLKSPEAHLRVVFTNKDHDKLDWITSRESDIKPTHIEDFLLQRTSYLNQINSTKMAIVVSGDPRRKAGEVIEFKLPQNMGNVSKRNPQELDNYLQGKFLVTGIKHTITQDKYQMHMEIVKDTFYSNIEHVDPRKVYENIY